MANKRKLIKHIINFTCLGISAIIYFVAFVMFRAGLNVIETSIYFGFTALFIVLIYMLEFFYIRSCKRNYGFVVAKFMLALASLIMTIVGWSVGLLHWLLFVNCLFAGLGYYVILLFVPPDFKFKPMTYKQKILEVLKQLGLIFVSLFIEIFVVYFFIGGHLLANFFVKELMYDELAPALKKNGFNDAYWHYGKAKRETYGGYYTTKSYDIKDSNGKVIGTVETNKDYIPEETIYTEEGWRKENYSDDFKDFIVWVQTILVFPFRIISFVLSIFALIFPWIYVSVKTPACDKKPINFIARNNDEFNRNKRYYPVQNVYNDYAFLFLDLLYPKN